MKLLFTMAALLMLHWVLFSGCKKDTQQTLSQSLIGKWKVDSMYMEVNVFGKDTVVGLPLQYAETIEFKSDLTYNDSTGIYAATTGKWTLVDSTLTMGGGIGQTVNIIQLDDVQLKTVLTENSTSRFFFWYTRQ